jgi:hypothetical protein
LKFFKQPPEPESFYIGWQPKAANEYRQFVRLLIFALIVVCYFTVSLLVSNQRGFSAGVFERNHETALEGVLQSDPFPAIKTFFGKDIFGNPLIKTILLVNQGKFGADSIVKKIISQDKGENTYVKINGKLIYNHGFALMELTEGESAIQKIKVPSSELQLITSTKIQMMDTVSIHGQIIDPKCYLGVMKPGEGKPHSDCAIRCIAGGIPPMLRIKNERGEETLFILRGENGETINEQVLPFVGIPVSVSGVVERADDWYVLKVNGIVSE